MTAAEIAETFINGNIADAREQINSANKPSVLALDVATELMLGCSDGHDIAMMLDKLRRCVAE